MKVGFFTQNNKRGGLDTFLINLINFWPKKNDNIFIFYNKSHKGIVDYKKKIKRKVKYINYDYSLSQDLNTPNSNFFFKLYIKLIRYIYLLNSIYIKPNYFKEIFKRNNIEKLLIVNGGYQGGEACNSALFGWKQYKPNYLPWYSFHNYAQKDKNAIHFIENFLRNLIDKKVLNSTRGMVSVSKSCIKSLKLRKNLNKIKTKVIYNGKNFLKKKNVHKKKNKKIKKIIMLAVLEPRKGFEYILKSMRIIKELDKSIKLYIYGDGNLNEKITIKKLIKEFNLKNTVSLNGFVQNTEKIFLESDLVAIPSQENESFGYVAVEAFFYKKPVIACATGGLNEIIRNNYDGFLVNKKNYKKFANKIIFLLKNNNLKNKFIKNGYYSYQKKFTANNMSQNYFNLIMNV